MYKIECIQSNGRGSCKEYKVLGRDDVLLTYDRETDPEYPWYLVPVVNGRLVSSMGYAYQTSRDALEALEDGSWKE